MGSRVVEQIANDIQRARQETELWTESLREAGGLIRDTSSRFATRSSGGGGGGGGHSRGLALQQDARMARTIQLLEAIALNTAGGGGAGSNVGGGGSGGSAGAFLLGF